MRGDIPFFFDSLLYIMSQTDSDSDEEGGAYFLPSRGQVHPINFTPVLFGGADARQKGRAVELRNYFANESARETGYVPGDTPLDPIKRDQYSRLLNQVAHSGDRHGQQNQFEKDRAGHFERDYNAFLDPRNRYDLGVEAFINRAEKVLLARAEKIGYDGSEATHPALFYGDIKIEGIEDAREKGVDRRLEEARLARIARAVADAEDDILNRRMGLAKSSYTPEVYDRLSARAKNVADLIESIQGGDAVVPSQTISLLLPPKVVSASLANRIRADGNKAKIRGFEKMFLKFVPPQLVKIYNSSD